MGDDRVNEFRQVDFQTGEGIGAVLVKKGDPDHFVWRQLRKARVANLKVLRVVWDVLQPYDPDHREAHDDRPDSGIKAGPTGHIEKTRQRPTRRRSSQ